MIEDIRTRTGDIVNALGGDGDLIDVHQPATVTFADCDMNEAQLMDALAVIENEYGVPIVDFPVTLDMEVEVLVEFIHDGLPS